MKSSWDSPPAPRPPTASGRSRSHTHYPAMHTARSETATWGNKLHWLKWQLNTFCTVEWGPYSSRLCSCRPWSEGPVPQIPLLLSWKTQPNGNWFPNELPCDEGRECYHFLLHCLDVQIGKNMASQRNISLWSIGYIPFMDYKSEHKVNDSDDGWVPDSE